MLLVGADRKAHITDMTAGLTTLSEPSLYLGENLKEEKGHMMARLNTSHIRVNTSHIRVNTSHIRAKHKSYQG